MRATPQTLATPARRSSDWRPARQSLAYGRSDYQSLDRSRRSAWPGSGHARTPPQEPQMPSKPTTRQLNYLRSLANQDRPDVHLPEDPPAGERGDRPAEAHPAQQPDRGSDRAQADRRPDRRPARSTPPAYASTRSPATGAPPPGRTTATAPAYRTQPGPPTGNRGRPADELARYTIPAGERVLYGQRVDGVVRVTDRPAHARRARLPGRARARAGRQRCPGRARGRLPRPSAKARSGPDERRPPRELAGGDRMNWQEPDDERSNEPGADFDDARVTEMAA